MALLSIVIPCLNEEENLNLLLDSLSKQNFKDFEILIADGGSQDGTQGLAHQFGAKFIESPKGRAVQMNKAVENSIGKYLLFLHADSYIPSNDFLKRALDEHFSSSQKNDKVATHFKLKFIRTKKNDGLDQSYNYIEEKTHLSRRYSVNGDQGMLLSKKYFLKLGKFDESFHFFEDQLIAENIYTSGRWHVADLELHTSARRFESEGFHNRYILLSLMMGLYWTGFKEFFTQAPGLYRNQDQASKLDVLPFFNLVFSMISSRSLWWRAKFWFRLGRYIRRNSWQMFYYFDISLRPFYGGKKIYPMLKFHDWIFWPITNHILGDLINTVISYFWFRWALPAKIKSQSIKALK